MVKKVNEEMEKKGKLNRATKSEEGEVITIIESSEKVEQNSRSNSKNNCFRLCDVFISLLVFHPLNICFWRGVWQLMEYHTNNGYILSILIGNIIPFLLYLFQCPLESMISPTKMPFVFFYLISRSLLLLHSFGSVNQWRGFWEFLDQSTPEGAETHSALLSLFISLTLLCAFKIFNNVTATPFIVGVDISTTVHACQLRFKTNVERKFLYFLDCFYSVIIVQNLVIAAWRGLWNLANLHLFPEDNLLSAQVSIGVGAMIVVFLSLIQSWYYRKMIKLSGIKRLVFCDFITIWAFIACVLTWRGTWEMLDIYIIFETPMHSEWVTTIVGAVGLVALGGVSTVMTKGVSVDGEDSGEGTEWPMAYVSLIQNKRTENYQEPCLFRYLCTSQKIRTRVNEKRSNYENHHKAEVPLKLLRNSFESGAEKGNESLDERLTMNE